MKQKTLAGLKEKAEKTKDILGELGGEIVQFYGEDKKYLPFVMREWSKQYKEDVVEADRVKAMRENIEAKNIERYGKYATEEDIAGQTRGWNQGGRVNLAKGFDPKRRLILKGMGA